ncbi:Trypanosomal VSG domain [Trypanosoma vivax]|nr:Trypanosomal VSG domain [Trypanosoma vivax]
MRDSHASTGHRGGANTEGAGDFGEAVGGKQERRDRENRRGARRSSSEQRDEVESRRKRGEGKCYAFGSEDARSRRLGHKRDAGARSGTRRASRSGMGTGRAAHGPAKKAANKALYGLINETADNISTLNESMVNWEIPGTPATQAIGTETGGGGEFTKHSGKALAADITCLCPSEGQHNECIKIQSGGKLIESKVKDVKTAVSHWNAMKNYCIAPLRGQATKGSILASIAQLKAMLGTNTKSETTGTNIPYITHALGQQAQPTSETQGVKFVTYGAYATGRIPWEQTLIDAGTAIDKARRLADHAQTAAELALGLVNAWNAPSRRGLNGHEEQSEAHEPEDARTRDKRGNRTGTQETHSSERTKNAHTREAHGRREGAKALRVTPKAQTRTQTTHTTFSTPCAQA